MKTSFDLPDQLLRRAKAAAAHQGRPLRDLVAEAIDEKLEGSGAAEHRVPGYREGRRQTWDEWTARLEKLPDGTWFNAQGADESFFERIEEIRRRSFGPRAVSSSLE